MQLKEYGKHLEKRSVLKQSFTRSAYNYRSIVDDYFAPVYYIEDHLNAIDDNLTGETAGSVLEEVFDIRADLSKLRRTIIPMRDLLYRILNSTRFTV